MSAPTELMHLHLQHEALRQGLLPSQRAERAIRAETERDALKIELAKVTADRDRLKRMLDRYQAGDTPRKRG